MKATSIARSSLLLGLVSLGVLASTGSSPARAAPLVASIASSPSDDAVELGAAACPAPNACAGYLCDATHGTTKACGAPPTCNATIQCNVCGPHEGPGPCHHVGRMVSKTVTTTTCRNETGQTCQKVEVAEVASGCGCADP